MLEKVIPWCLLDVSLCDYRDRNKHSPSFSQNQKSFSWLSSARLREETLDSQVIISIYCCCFPLGSVLGNWFSKISHDPVLHCSTDTVLGKVIALLHQRKYSTLYTWDSSQSINQQLTIRNQVSTLVSLKPLIQSVSVGKSQDRKHELSLSPFGDSFSTAIIAENSLCKLTATLYFMLALSWWFVPLFQPVTYQSIGQSLVGQSGSQCMREAVHEGPHSRYCCPVLCIHASSIRS